jgi:hypothetical protein
MWLGRRDLGDARLAARLVVVGVVLALVGSVGGRAIGDRVGADGLTTGPDGQLTFRADRVAQVEEVFGTDIAAVEANLSRDPVARRTQLLQTLAYAEDRSARFHIGRLFDASGHSEMPAWVIGATGTALAALGACVLLADRFGAAAEPFVALGQLSLTAYVAQALVIRWTPEVAETTTAQEFGITAALLAGLVLVAWTWRRFLRRGPLEALLHLVARP